MLRRTICNIIQRTVFINVTKCYALRETSTIKPDYLCKSYQYSHQNLNIIPKRFKSSKQQPTKHYSEEDEEDGKIIDKMENIDDYLYTDKSKLIETTVPSLRVDAIAKVGFGMSRSKVETEFYKSNFRINEEKILKKNVDVKVGDEIDYVLRRSPDNAKFLIVHRCILIELRIVSESFKVKLIQNKNLLIEDYDDPWSGAS